MPLPPEAVRQRQWILDELARLLGLGGVSGFAFGPIYLAEERWFPDDWRPDVTGAKAMLDRLMAYAGLSRVRTLMRSERDAGRALAEMAAVAGTSTTHQGAAAWFSGANASGAYLFGVEEAGLREPETLVGVLAHEVAHAWRFRNDVVVSDDATEERLTDLTTVFLGFGVLTTNNTLRVRGEVGGSSRSRYGYLSPAELGFALAVQLALRDDAAERAMVLGALEQDQRIIVKEALDVLVHDPGGLLVRLGLPEREAWPRRAAPRVPAPVKLHAPPGGAREIVFRVRTVPVIAFTIAGVVIGASASIAALTPWLLLVPIACAALSLLVRRDLCSGPDCGKAIPAAAVRCPTCGGQVAGRIRRRRDHLKAEQDFFGLSDLDVAPQVRALAQAALRQDRSRTLN